MAWTSPMTASTNGTLTAAQWNTHVRDNLLETEAGKATRRSEVSGDPDEKTESRPGTWFVATGNKAIAERSIQEGSVSSDVVDTTTSTTFTDLDDSFGPALTVVTGTAAIVMMTLEMGNSAANTASWASYEVSGATTSAADDARGARADGYTAGDNLQRRAVYHRQTGLTAGENIFTMKYRTAGSTGKYRMRQLVVWPI